jgi:hypothetical protein
MKIKTIAAVLAGALALAGTARADTHALSAFTEDPNLAYLSVPPMNVAFPEEATETLQVPREYLTPTVRASAPRPTWDEMYNMERFICPATTGGVILVTWRNAWQCTAP